MLILTLMLTCLPVSNVGNVISVLDSQVRGELFDGNSAFVRSAEPDQVVSKLDLPRI